jgi:dolichol-phosphate mannosyltransferase
MADSSSATVRPLRLLSVVIPVYNERATIAELIRRVEQTSYPKQIVVVDDASRDGTAELADALAGRDPQVHVLHRERKDGIGRAYTAGFTEALAPGADLLVQMDADLSHDPADLPRLVGAAEAGADLVLGSRYVPGGGVENWGLDRRVLSRFGCAYARRVLGVGVRDLTGGFKCFRAAALLTVEYPSAGAQGYAFQVELTWRALQMGLHVLELPITFRERRHGRSKMSARIAREAVWRVPALRFGPGRWRGLVPEAPSADPLAHEG